MYSVILELDGFPPQVLAEHHSWERAKQVAMEAAWLHNKTGGKVTVSKPESSDQLQKYSKGFHRDQPQSPAVGEDLTVLVPTVHYERQP